MSLTCRDVAVEYSSAGYAVRPIDGLDLNVDPGEIVLLLGASGSGKTTLLSVLAAILRPARGSVQLDGIEVTRLEGEALTDYRRQTVGIVFQAFNLVPSLTAVENVQIPLLADGLSPRAARERARGLLERVGLSDRLRHRPGSLSGGQQQRVAIARALALDPRLVLADEPTAHLDYVQVEGVLKLLQEIVESGRIVIVATHDERLTPLADRVVNLSPRPPEEEAEPRHIALQPGQILFEQGDPADIIYVVEEGEVDVFRRRDDGSEELLDRVRPGNYFGELAPLFGIRRSASARAVGSAQVVGLSVAEFRSRFDLRPKLATGADS